MGGLIITMGFIFGPGRPDPELLMALSLLTWAVVLVDVWAIVVLLCHGLSAADRPQVRAAAAAAGPGAAHVDIEAARQQVSGPATGLLVVGIINCLFGLLALLAIPALVLLEPRYEAPKSRHLTSPVRNAVSLLWPGAPGATLALPALPLAQAGESSPEGRAGGITAVGLLGVLALLLYLPCTVFILIGAVKMRRLSSYGLAMLAAILAMLPLTPMFLIGLPIGIWALVVLGRADVKAAFARVRMGGGGGGLPGWPPGGAGQGLAQAAPHPHAVGAQPDVQALGGGEPSPYRLPTALTTHPAEALWRRQPTLARNAVKAALVLLLLVGMGVFLAAHGDNDSVRIGLFDPWYACRRTPDGGFASRKSLYTWSALFGVVAALSAYGLIQLELMDRRRARARRQGAGLPPHAWDGREGAAAGRWMASLAVVAVVLMAVGLLGVLVYRLYQLAAVSG